MKRLAVSSQLMNPHQQQSRKTEYMYSQCAIYQPWVKCSYSICTIHKYTYNLVEKNCEYMYDEGAVSIAHTIHPHNLTFISRGRKGFNQDFIKRYLCNALNPGMLHLSFSSEFQSEICRRGEKAFKNFKMMIGQRREKVFCRILNPRAWVYTWHG